MRKREAFESGGFESAAILGQDMGCGLEWLVAAVEVPVSRDLVEFFTEKGAVVAGVAFLLVGGGCLAFAVHTDNLLMAALLVPLLAGAAWFTHRLATLPEEDVFLEAPGPVLVSRVCGVCREPFLDERVATKDAGSAPRDPGLAACSLRCSEALRARAG